MVFFMRFNFLKIILRMGYEVLWGFFIVFLGGSWSFCFWGFFETETNLVFDTEVLKDQCV